MKTGLYLFFFVGCCMKQKNNYLSILLFIILLFAIDSPHSFCQMFRLTDIYSEQFSIDRIAQEVYFQDLFTDTIRAVSLKNLSVINKTGRRVLLPFFGNKKHIILYGNNSSIGDSAKDNIFLYDLDKESYYLITDTIGFPFASNYLLSFSPNDSNFIFIDNHYLSLKDSLFYPIESNLSIDFNETVSSPQWSSDTSFVFLSGNDAAILEYFLKSKKIDTLVVADSQAYLSLQGFAYNTKDNILAYCTYYPPKIYFHYKDTNEDSLVFLPERDDPDAVCWDTGDRGITSMCWSPDNEKLAFLGFQFIDISAAGIYVYLLDSNKTYRATDCNDGGLKYYMRWANNSVLIYANTTDGYLYGFDVSSVIMSVEQTGNEEEVTGFSLYNYPNPFNPVTKISWLSPIGSWQTLKVYDILGNEITTLVNEYKPKGNYEIEFDATGLPSGVYFYRLKAGDFIKTNKMLLLK